LSTKQRDVAFIAFFEDYGVSPMPMGCVSREDLLLYTTEYNRIVRDYLTDKYGRDLIQEFRDAYREEQGLPPIETAR
jgi:hypothetical protein